MRLAAGGQRPDPSYRFGPHPPFFTHAAPPRTRLRENPARTASRVGVEPNREKRRPKAPLSLPRPKLIGCRGYAGEPGRGQAARRRAARGWRARALTRMASRCRAAGSRYWLALIDVGRDVEELVGRVANSGLAPLSCAELMVRSAVALVRSAPKSVTEDETCRGGRLVDPAGIRALHGVEREAERAVRGIGAQGAPDAPRSMTMTP